MSNNAHPPFETAPSELVIVVLEDEPIIRMVACAALGDAGFNVVETGHADEALAALESQAPGIHALFTDVHVPGSMNGLELAHHSRRSWPWLAVLIASGRAMPAAHEMPDGARFLQKPYALEHVISHLRDLMHP